MIRRKTVTVLLVLALIVSIFPQPLYAADAASVSAGLNNFKAVNRYADGMFSDVKSSDWYARYVEWAYTYALMGGPEEGFFNAGGNVTIAETVTMAANLHAVFHTGSKSFGKSDPWYQVYVDYALENGIISAGQFKKYDAPATRIDFVTVLSAAFPGEAFPAINAITEIPDVPKTMANADKVYLFYNAGILAGNDKYGTFAPESKIKRSEVAVVLRNMVMKQYRGKTVLEKPPVPSDLVFKNTWNPESYGGDGWCTIPVGESFRTSLWKGSKPLDNTIRVTYASSDTRIATVTWFGRIVGRSPGKTTVTATTPDGMIATCTVVVEDREPDTNKTVEPFKDGLPAIIVNYSPEDFDHFGAHIGSIMRTDFDEIVDKLYAAGYANKSPIERSLDYYLQRGEIVFSFQFKRRMVRIGYYRSENGTVVERENTMVTTRAAAENYIYSKAGIPGY